MAVFGRLEGLASRESLADIEQISQRDGRQGWKWPETRFSDCTGSLVADIQQIPHRKHLANSIHPFTTDSLEARPSRRPNTAIQDFHASQKKNSVKTSLD